MTEPEGVDQNSRGIQISYQMNEDGFGVEIFGKKYIVSYPKNLYSALDDNFKKLIAENFIYCRLKALSLQTDQILHFNFSKPAVKDLVAFGIINDIPRLAYFNKVDPKVLLGIFERNKDREVFRLNQSKLAKISLKTDSKDVILALSFGKDSLLSYALLKELGFSIKIVYVKEVENLDSPEEDFEEYFKEKIIIDFIKNEKVEMEYITDQVDHIFYNNKFDRVIVEWEGANAILAFSLELLPLAYFHRAQYLVFGNEANFSDYYQAGEYKLYPSFDQSIIYSPAANKAIGQLTNDQIKMLSLVEPIYNIVEMGILVNRYPEFLKYIMSCSPKDKEHDRWCYDCPMCAKFFVFSKAVGGDPRISGFNEDLFSIKYKNLYPLFNSNTVRVYEKPPAVRDEQLLAFLLAYRRGVKGDLMDLFEKEYLLEAEKRETELRQKFLAIHPMVTVPDFIKDKLLNIYQEEIIKI